MKTVIYIVLLINIISYISSEEETITQTVHVQETPDGKIDYSQYRPADEPEEKLDVDSDKLKEVLDKYYSEDGLGFGDESVTVKEQLGELDEKLYGWDKNGKFTRRILSGYNVTKRRDMVYMPSQRFRMGTERPIIRADGEGPSRPVKLKPYWFDRYEVDNEQFRIFVEETGYQTEAEKFGWSFVFFDQLSIQGQAKAKEFVAGAEWWTKVEGATWEYPEGPDGKSVWESDRLHHPVVQVSWNDANAFCEWRDSIVDKNGTVVGGTRLPTEAEFEYSARGGKSGRLFPWGNALKPHKQHRANLWQGQFPFNNTAEDGFLFTCSVDDFGEQNGFGLYNIGGNVWEWVSDWWTIQHPRAEGTEAIKDPQGPETGTEKTKKGGSFLCHKSYCYRYRVVARHKSTPDSTTTNNGFRCARAIDANEMTYKLFNKPKTPEELKAEQEKMEKANSESETETETETDTKSDTKSEL